MEGEDEDDLMGYKVLKVTSTYVTVQSMEDDDEFGSEQKVMINRITLVTKDIPEPEDSDTKVEKFKVGDIVSRSNDMLRSHVGPVCLCTCR